jgi:hypothetical protein
MNMRRHDVALEHAMIAWNPLPYGDGRIAIIPHPDNDGWTDHLKLSDTTGACWNYWGEMSNEDRLGRLFMEGWIIVCRDGLDPKAIHEAFMVIPEYRASLNGETMFRDKTGSADQ